MGVYWAFPLTPSKKWCIQMIVVRFGALLVTSLFSREAVFLTISSGNEICFFGTPLQTRRIEIKCMVWTQFCTLKLIAIVFTNSNRTWCNFILLYTQVCEAIRYRHFERWTTANAFVIVQIIGRRTVSELWQNSWGYSYFLWTLLQQEKNKRFK